MKPAPISCADITARLIRDRYRRTFCIPRYTPRGWWEADLFELSGAGYFREYEIKTSRSDFLRDCAKGRDPVRWALGPTKRETKHELLAQKSPRGPVQFWFVAPEGVIRYNEIPEWAGFIEIIRPEGSSRLTEILRTQAPRLHGEKCSEEVVKHARGVCYWRYNNLLVQVPKLREVTKKQVGLLRKFGWPRVKPQPVPNESSK